MKLKNLALLPLAACAVFGAVAQADTITFRGTVIENTCIPAVNGNGRDAAVVLPIVSTADFPAQGNTTGDTSFSIDLTACSTAATYPVRAYFWNSEAVNGRLVKGTSAGNGDGWSYQLLASGNTNQLDVGTTATVVRDLTDPGVTITPGSGGNGTLNYTVRYYNEVGTTMTPGTFNAVATYVLYIN